MNPSNLSRETGEILNQNSVKFSNNLRYNDQKAWPYWYPFIPYPYLDSDSQNNGLGLQGFRVPAGGSINIPIVLDRDSAFRLINFKYSVMRDAIGEQLDAAAGGDISVLAGGTAVTGVNTTFTDLAAGDPLIWVDDNGLYQSGVIASITNDLALVLESAATNAATNVPYFRRALKWYDTIPNQQVSVLADLTGTITIAPGGTAIVGVLTLFVAELAVGDVITAIDAAGTRRYFMIASITDNLNADVTETLAAGDPGVAAVAFQLAANVLPSGGAVTITAANDLITGAGTTFSSDIASGDVLFYPDTSGVVQKILLESQVSDTLAKSHFITTASGAGVDMAIGVHSANAAPVPVNLMLIRPLTTFVRVGVSLPSLGDRNMYGGPQDFSENTGILERPLPIKALQGIDDGMGMLRTPSLLPFEGRIIIKVTNNFSEAVIINGAAFGYKIALEGEQ